MNTHRLTYIDLDQRLLKTIDITCKTLRVKKDSTTYDKVYADGTLLSRSPIRVVNVTFYDNCTGDMVMDNQTPNPYIENLARQRFLDGQHN